MNIILRVGSSEGGRLFRLVDFSTPQAQRIYVEEAVSPITSDVDQKSEYGSTLGLLKIKQGLHRRAEYFYWLYNYCRAHPDSSVTSRDPGANKRGENGTAFAVKEEPVFCYASHGKCVRAALANAMRAFFGEKIAKDLVSREHIPIRSIGDTHKWLASSKRCYQLKKKPHPSRTEIYAWLEELSDGFFPVRLASTDVHEESIHHVVVFDARKECNLIIDSAGLLALKMEEGALRACVGDKIELERIMEVRALTIQKK